MWPFRRRPDIERLAARRDVAGLARALTNEDQAIRRAAATALGGCPAGPAALALALALTDPDDSVRTAAGTALGRLAPGPAVAALRTHLRAAPDEAALVLAALGRLAADDTARATLEDALSDPDPARRVAAARALGRRGDAQSVPPLIAALDDADAHVRVAASIALAAVGPDRSLAPLVAVLRGGALAARSLAAETLGAMTDARALTPLAEALADDDAIVRAAALAAIERLPEPGRQIAAMAATPTEPVARERAAQRLRQIGSLPPLRGALAARDFPGLRAAAARAIARLGEPGVVEALVGAMRDPEPAVRLEATWMLGVTGRPEALDPLVAALAGAPDPAVRAAAARALGRLGRTEAAAALDAARSDTDATVQAAAARAAASLATISTTPEPDAGNILQVVIFQTDPGDDGAPADVAALLDDAMPEALTGETDIQVVTMVPGRPLPTVDDALTIVRRQFRTAPPGHAWRTITATDDAGRTYLVLQLQATT